MRSGTRYSAPAEWAKKVWSVVNRAVIRAENLLGESFSDVGAGLHPALRVEIRANQRGVVADDAAEELSEMRVAEHAAHRASLDPDVDQVAEVLERIHLAALQWR